MFRSTRWFAHELARQQAEWARERRMLVETICHLSGRPVPVEPAFRPPPESDPFDEELRALVEDPEQLPV